MSIKRSTIVACTRLARCGLRPARCRLASFGTYSYKTRVVLRVYAHCATGLIESTIVVWADVALLQNDIEIGQEYLRNALSHDPSILEGNPCELTDLLCLECSL